MFNVLNWIYLPWRDRQWSLPQSVTILLPHSHALLRGIWTFPSAVPVCANLHVGRQINRNTAFIRNALLPFFSFPLLSLLFHSVCLCMCVSVSHSLPPSVSLLPHPTSHFFPTPLESLSAREPKGFYNARAHTPWHIHHRHARAHTWRDDWLEKMSVMM